MIGRLRAALIRKLFGVEVERLRLERGDIVLVRGKLSDSGYVLRDLARARPGKDLGPIPLVQIPPDVFLERVDEQRMNEAGWHRAPALSEDQSGAVRRVLHSFDMIGIKDVGDRQFDGADLEQLRTLLPASRAEMEFDHG